MTSPGMYKLEPSVFRSGALPELSKAVKSAALEAASSSTRGSGWALSEPATLPGSGRAAQSRQAPPEEAQEPSWVTA
eukprot:scaffold3386_cov59-Phaeocystis_antarctica.AAC.5